MSNEALGLGLWDKFTRSGQYRSALHCWVGGRYDATPWDRVLQECERTTAGLRNLGVGPGTRVAAILTNTSAAVRGLVGVWLAGGAVASLPVPARGMDATEYADQLLAIGAQLDPVVFLLDEPLLAVIPESLHARFRFRSWESVADSGRVAPDPPGADSLAFIQYSSGSTRAPKGCMLTPRAIAAQLDMIATMIDARPGHDVGLSWMPLSHDMGLFGCLLTTWLNDIEYFMSTPERFMVAPGTWFAEMAAYGGTLSAGTNTSLFLAARAARRSTTIAAGGLGQVRNCIIAAERVEWSTVRFALDALGRYGFRPPALMPAYGMAEATLAVTSVPSDEEPRGLIVDSTALADGAVTETAADDPTGTAMVSAGRPCAGVSLPGLSADRLTEITVRSPSLALGYWADEAGTERQFADGGLRSGDLGFVRDGELYPVGRMDDVVSVAGRKVYAREVENAVDRIDGVRRGCSTLVARSEGAAQRLSLFVELRSTAAEYRYIADAAAAVALAKAGIALDECVILDRDCLPKTPSGKIQRHRCRSLYEAGSLQPLATVRFGGAAAGRPARSGEE
ncbi:AMP-binding protein [Nocardia sp. NPDC051321]|uniref:AMP-binding protein n=1 Tax=Nocardia sp. NPDC051321 TaxID=3364323 RepID=UPI00378E40DB